MHYRDFLREEFSVRKARNPSYSLRSFARDLKISASQLSEVMSQKKALSRKSAAKICSILDVKPGLRDLFLLSVDADHDHSLQPAALTWKQWLDKNYLVQGMGAPLKLDEAKFAIVSDVRPHVLFAMFGLKSFRMNRVWICKVLGIFQSQLRELFRRLQTVGAIDWDEKGDPRLKGEHFSSTDGVPSSAIRAYHRATLSHALECMENVPVGERDFRSVIFAVDQRDFLSIQSEVVEFQKMLYQKYGKKPTADRVYGFQSQIVPYTPMLPQEQEVKCNLTHLESSV